MAVELMMNYINTTRNNMMTNLEENPVVQEAESVEKFIKLLSQGNLPSFLKQEKSIEIEADADADAAVTKFKKVISLLGRTRTGHARFRRAPITASPPPHPDYYGDTKVYCPTPIQQHPPFTYNPKDGVVAKQELVTKTVNFSEICRSNSFNIGETESKAFQISNISQVSSSVKPPFKITKCTSSENGLSGKCSGSSGRCHCSKRRKLRLKRVVRVPAISMKLSDIPPDDYSWRKYGQKPIKGSPHPRAYYKCSSVRGCPVRKHVERALDEPTMLIVTYEAEHNHSLSVAETSSLILESS
ncbi:hypothetical protein RND71_019598 [Anisodus tanguticus]|uniref:WRKY domain-containing protein n=1 Tax=Anisodus tanguticus TaxID=243964 RepID=A0AAE1RZE7_9SOLA|nr:hypothetical protein RND71_019598 [Anisodus tanguticus]